MLIVRADLDLEFVCDLFSSQLFEEILSDWATFVYPSVRSRHISYIFHPFTYPFEPVHLPITKSRQGI
jgi:hypothetical protein